MSYIAGFNEPGYLPTAEPVVFETLDRALQYLIDELSRLIDDCAETGDNDAMISLEADLEELMAFEGRLADNELPFEFSTSLGEVFWIVKGPS